VSEPLSSIRGCVRKGQAWLGSPQERFEASRLGRVVISVFLLVTLAAVAVGNLPDSIVKRTLAGPAGPYLNATGLDQNWGVFAPDGRQFGLSLVATVRYADGSTAAWPLPQAGPLLGAYWDYRWRKWAENLMTLGSEGAVMRTPAAVWIAREMTRPGKRPVRVTLASRRYDLFPPGDARGDLGSWKETTFYGVNFREPR
jgi:hypothetical protein